MTPYMVCVILNIDKLEYILVVRITFKSLESLDEVLQLTSPFLYGNQVSSRNPNNYASFHHQPHPLKTT